MRKKIRNDVALSNATMTVNGGMHGDLVYHPCEIQRTNRVKIERMLDTPGIKVDLILNCGHSQEVAFFIEHLRIGYRAWVCKQVSPHKSKRSAIKDLAIKAKMGRAKTNVIKCGW